MALRIEDYALIGDTQTAALVGRDGSIDWLCVPRFDSGACFAALLGETGNGRWLLAPQDPTRTTSRRYRPDSLVLETLFETDTGAARVVDCMPLRDGGPNVVRLVEGVRGQVRMRMELVIRFDYGSIVPWVRNINGVLQAIAGPDVLYLRTPVPLKGQDLRTVAEFAVSEGEQIPFVLSWHQSHMPIPDELDAAKAVKQTEAWWREWAQQCTYEGEWRDPVLRSLITLKALTYAPTGGIVAAATTSLPEWIGGQRNWDYRYCWLRDATFTLYAFMTAGYKEEAAAWRDWLLRAAAGDPSQLQIMYGPAGERRLTELELEWLPGYEGSRPVRIGNAATRQLQFDVYGELLDSMYQAARIGIKPDEYSWALQRALVNFLESHWDQPDEGIWEVRGRRRHFTHSKIMSWVAMDRAVKAVENFGLPGPVEKWRKCRAEIHAQVCRQGYDRARNTFIQSYGAKELDASLLMMPLVGFLPAHDPRVRGTVEAIERELCWDGFVRRYPTRRILDGLPPGEGVFLACTYWLADNYALLGRTTDARRLFERLLGLRNDVGLLAEEYDPEGQRLLGNFPQAFSHVGLINTAYNLSLSEGPAHNRKSG
jgi:GH15 family glucan-1,4-alpha-glucosidase